MSTNYKSFNPNPDTKKYTHGKKKGKTISHSDCVIRAFCKLFKEDWITVYKKLCDRGLGMFEMPSHRSVWKSYLQQNKSFTTLLPGHRLTVSEVAEQTKGKRKVYIAACQHHIVAISNGCYYDSWDSGSEPVYSVWELNDYEK